MHSTGIMLYFIKGQCMLTEHCFAILQSQGLIKVQGPDAKKFLQGQLSCDMEAITPEQSGLAVHCNLKGRIIGSFRVWLWDQTYYLSAPLSTLQSSLDALKKYAIFSQVEILQEESIMQQIICGNDRILDSIEIPLETNQNAYNDHMLLTKIPGDISCYHALHSIDSPIPLPTHTEISETAIALQSIRAGIATITAATQEKFTPHALNMQYTGAISFTKGCYTGQEIVARMQYLGKLKEHLYHVGFSTSQAPAIGETLISSEKKAVGHIINYCQTAEDQYECLAVIKKKNINDVYVEREGLIMVSLLPLPYEISS